MMYAHVSSCIHVILVYRCYKPASNVLLSIQFVIHNLEMCAPLNSPKKNCRHVLYLHFLRVNMFWMKKGWILRVTDICTGLFLLFSKKKMDSRAPDIKKMNKTFPVIPDVSLTSVVRWHTSAPPHLTTDVSPWQLSMYYSTKRGRQRDGDVTGTRTIR
jgi:hypothetical protein